MIRRARLAVATLLTVPVLAGTALGLGAPVAAAAVTISPLPGTLTAQPQTQISFLGATAASLRSITVAGSLSGQHSGHLRRYSSQVGTSFVPSKPFTPGERVLVRARVSGGKGKRSTISSVFTIAQPGVVTPMEFTTGPGKPADVQSFRSQPEMHPPTVTVHKGASASAPGYLFAAPFLGPGQWGPMIFDNDGSLVWFRPLPAGEDAADFRTQIYKGKNDLTWWEGRTLQFGYGLGKDVIASANYKAVAVVRAGNGLQADEHEFLVQPDGSAYILAYNPVITNLASAGGSTSGLALDCIIQRIDVHTGLVMWEWHSLGHVDPSESYSKLPGVATNPFDYFHINSLTTDSHGNPLISARNTWALYDINAQTGAVTWRLGGKHSSFALGAGVPFAYQHNALWLSHDQISLFDDEGAPPINPPSRGEIVKLDLKAKTATLVRSFVRNPGPLTTGSQGNLQSLPGGRWLVGWGGLPNFTEFNSAGEVVYDAQLPTDAPLGEFSYRVYRDPWIGQPSTPPTISARTSAGATAVYASWNGATTVASWQLLTGASQAHMSAVSTTRRSGFETVIPAPSGQAFYRVRALSPSGKILATSGAVAPTSG